MGRATEERTSSVFIHKRGVRLLHNRLFRHCAFFSREWQHLCKLDSFVSLALGVVGTCLLSALIVASVNNISTVFAPGSVIWLNAL